jgi:hypothetical protein
MAGKAQEGEAQEGEQFVNPDLSSHHAAHHYFCLSIWVSPLQLVIPFVKSITAREEKEGTRDQGVGTSREEGNRDPGFGMKGHKKNRTGNSPSPLILSLGGERKIKERKFMQSVR